VSVSNQHNYPLVVPKQATHAFHGEILPKQPIPLSIAKPRTALGKINFYAKKSLLLSGPIFGFGSAFLLTDISTQALHSGSAITAAVTFFATTVTLGSGVLSFGAGLGSLLRGDNEFSPLPPSQSYLLALQEEQENLIAPFSDWDNVFSKHDNRAKLEQII
jgi:hypothetical protein